MAGIMPIGIGGVGELMKEDTLKNKVLIADDDDRIILKGKARQFARLRFRFNYHE